MLSFTSKSYQVVLPKPEAAHMAKFDLSEMMKGACLGKLSPSPFVDLFDINDFSKELFNS